ncbi:MAG: selenide, water dikinase SelD [Candidatus Lokiarchaeota archaeon]|nr:selenide, water dikinase SelD [Candidatus Lokiarchaeota archaeon]
MNKIELENLIEKSGIKIKSPRIIKGIGDDAAVIKINDDLVAIKTIDVFTPIIDDPIIQGKLTACNVTSDIYAMGAVDILGVLVFLAIDSKMPLKISSDLLKGFQEFCEKEKTTIIGGQTIQNPWPLIGGEATGICKIDNVIYSTGVKLNDILVLTKPLGIQPIMAAYRIVRDDNNEFMDYVYEIIDKKELRASEKLAIESMTKSNKPVAEVFQKVPVHAATDITGFGLIGHTEEMLVNETKIDIEITKMPIFKGALGVSELCSYGLEEGRAAETAGGFLISVAPDHLDNLISELKRNNVNPHIVGKAIPGSGKVKISKKVEMHEIKVV